MVQILRDVVLFGPPGVGKGAQAAILSGRVGLVRLSMGDALRAEASSGSTLGCRIRARIDAGHFADDETVCAIVESSLSRQPASRFVLDGFPRTIAQAERFERWLASVGRSVERALLITAPEATILARLCGRLVCSRCEQTFHASFRPPRVDGSCDRCGGVVARRADDDPGVQSGRLVRYRQRTAPLVEFYRARGVLYEIDGGGSVPQVWRRVRRSLRA